jgi:autonomous glycyl radical cofactor GrcA
MKDIIINLENDFFKYHCNFNNDDAKCHDFAEYHVTTETYESHGFHTKTFYELLNEDEIPNDVKEWIKSEEGQDLLHDFVLRNTDEDKWEEVDKYYSNINTLKQDYE